MTNRAEFHRIEAPGNRFFDGSSVEAFRTHPIAKPLQEDEVVQRRNADGSLSWEVVEGANKGMRIYQGFTPVGADATMVTFRAEAPATGIKRVLKPLFEIAIRRVVEKGIEEDRLDLEERGYGTER